VKILIQSICLVIERWFCSEWKLRSLKEIWLGYRSMALTSFLSLLQNFSFEIWFRFQKLNNLQKLSKQNYLDQQCNFQQKLSLKANQTVKSLYFPSWKFWKLSIKFTLESFSHKLIMLKFILFVLCWSLFGQLIDVNTMIKCMEISLSSLQCWFA
jgi:hypothetical protein